VFPNPYIYFCVLSTFELSFVALLLFQKTYNADHFLNHRDFAFKHHLFVKGKDTNNLRPDPGKKCMCKEQGCVVDMGCEHLTT
jgi:hypothetical protein